MNVIATIFVLALTCEALVEYGKLIFVERKINWKQIAAIIIGVGLAVATGVDLYRVIGVDFKIPIVGSVLTGILFSRGSNWLADFIKKIQTPKLPDIPEGD